MENASKALIIAGMVLISVMVISLFMYVFSSIMEFQTDSKAQLQSSQITAFNRFFVESYDLDYGKSGYQINGSDVYNIIRKVDDINNNPDIDVEITISPNTYVATFFKSGDEIKDSMKETYTYEYTLGSDGYVRKINFGPVS